LEIAGIGCNSLFFFASVLTKKDSVVPGAGFVCVWCQNSFKYLSLLRDSRILLPQLSRTACWIAADQKSPVVRLGCLIRVLGHSIWTIVQRLLQIISQPFPLGEIVPRAIGLSLRNLPECNYD